MQNAAVAAGVPQFDDRTFALAYNAKASRTVAPWRLTKEEQNIG